MRKNKKQRIREKRERIKNKKLCKKYPWLIPKYGWPAKPPKDYDYSWIMWYGWPSGWNKAFGKMYLEELGDAVERAGFKDIFTIEEMKEKYGRCMLYCSPVNDEIDEITAKYETLSENICQICGKPDVPILYDGYWIYTWCYNCIKKLNKMWTGVEEETEIRRIYEEQCKDDGKMADYIEWKINGNVVKKDISVTANKIRARWRKMTIK